MEWCLGLETSITSNSLIACTFQISLLEQARQTYFSFAVFFNKMQQLEAI